MRRFQRSTRSPAATPKRSEGRYEIVAARPVADLEPVRSRSSQMNASWKTESPNWERNWAVQSVAIPPGARRGPALVGSGPLAMIDGVVRESRLRGRRGSELRSVVLEVPQEGR